MKTMNLADSGLETYMNFMLIRFGLIAAGVAALVIIGFTILVVLKRKGKIEQTRRYIEPMARNLMERQANNSGNYNTRGAVGRGLKRTAARAVVNYLNSDDKGNRDNSGRGNR
jgi:hypothetical protein